MFISDVMQSIAESRRIAVLLFKEKLSGRFVGGACRMEQRTLEGTWEEIALHGGELVGRRVRVTILDDLGPQVTLEKALAHLISSAESLSGSLPKIESSLATEAWSDGVDEKFRRQGFTL